MKWILENKEWLFSGIGVAIILGLVNYFWKRKPKKGSTETDNSINQTIGKEITTKSGNIEFTGNKQQTDINKKN